MVEHDQSIVNSETRLVGELGLTDWLAADLVLPFRVFETRIHYLDPQTGQPVTIENPFIHHHNETLVGPADPWITARFALATHGLTVSARFGTTLPVGSTVPNPFVLGDMGLPHEHTQFGTGTFEPIAGLEAYRTFGGVNVDAYWLTIQSLYENGYGYRAGNRYAVGASAASNLGARNWRFRTMLERSSESAERWNGVVNTTEGNIGRVDIMAGVEAAYAINDDWRAAFAIKVPLYTHVVGGEVDVPLYASLTISTHVHLWKHRHEHGGSAPVLVPVAGKLTVYDFGADWCAPCHQLEHELAEVVRRHPNDVEVRKITVVDSDSPAWIAYLAPGGFNLPHVKLFGRDGKLLWERSGAPPMLAAGVEDAITGAHVTQQPLPPPPDGTTRVEITVTDAGYTPEHVAIPRGQPVVLVFTRKSENTCAVDVHLKLPDGTKIDRPLPLGQPVEIPLRIDAATTIPYACGMDMLHGDITVR
jgi:thiol-disulfide isomerase/thioredoxin